MKILTLLLLLLSVIAFASCYNVFFGTQTSDMKLVYRQKVEYNAIPWRKRVKYFSYDDPNGRSIRTILCYDYLRSEASVNVTDGGLGYEYVTLRMKSQRSYGLDYAVEIYA